MIGKFILSTLVGYYLLDSLAKLLNLRSLQTQVPKEFLDVYDANRYRRSQEYTRLNTWFELVVSTIELAALLIFWFLGGFEALDQLIRGFHLPLVLNGLLYLGILCAAREALTLPFAIYHTFVIEQRYGFNRTTVATFIADRAERMAPLGSADGRICFHCSDFVRDFRPPCLDCRVALHRCDIGHFNLPRADRHPAALF